MGRGDPLSYLILSWGAEHGINGAELRVRVHKMLVLHAMLVM